MPVQSCRCPEGRTGYQWGDTGTCYCRRDPDEARDLAERQGRAIRAAGYRSDTGPDVAEQRAALARAPGAFPDREVMRYDAMMRGYARRLGAVYRRELVRAMREARTGRADAAPDPGDADPAMVLAIERALTRLRVRLPSIVDAVAPPLSRVLELARSIYRRTTQATARTVARLRPEGTLPELDTIGEADVLTAWAQQHATDIETVAERYHDDVAQKVTRAAMAGQRPSAIASLISLRTGVSESGAQRIARTEASRLHGRIRDEGYQRAGAIGYRWLSGRDARVRPTHRAAHGRVFRFKEGVPSVIDGRICAPSQDVNCRCDSEPVFADDERGDLPDLREPTEAILAARRARGDLST